MALGTKKQQELKELQAADSKDSNLPARLRLLRLEKGLTISAVAKEIGVSYASLAQYESGERSPNPVTRNKLANFYNVDVAYLSGQTNIRNAELIDMTSSTLTDSDRELMEKYAQSDIRTKKIIEFMLDPSGARAMKLGDETL